VRLYERFLDNPGKCELSSVGGEFRASITGGDVVAVAREMLPEFFLIARAARWKIGCMEPGHDGLIFYIECSAQHETPEVTP